jgi:hypothetical protein
MTGPDGGTPGESPSRDTVPAAVGDRLVRLAAGAVVVGLVVLVFVRSGGEQGPAAVPAVATSPALVALPADPGPTPTRGVLAQGTASDGSVWFLSLDGPTSGACLTVDAADGSGTRPGGCTPPPAGAGGTSPDAYRPLMYADDGVPPFVLGRMPAAVTEVEVILGDGGSLGRVPVVRGAGGPFYAVEVTGGSSAIAVFGYRPDGTSVRFDLPR